MKPSPHMTVTETTLWRRSSAGAALREAARDILSAGQDWSGFYKVQIVPGAPWSPVRIWRGFGFEPRTFHFREVAFCWRALLLGIPVVLSKVWPDCSWNPIGRAEYRYRLALYRYALKYEPTLPEARPHQAVDFEQLQHSFAR